MNYYDLINPDLELKFVSNLTKNHALIFQSQWFQPTSWSWSWIGYWGSPPQNSSNCWKQNNEYFKKRLSIFPHTTTLCHSSFLKKDDGNSKLFNCTNIVVKLLIMTSSKAYIHHQFPSYMLNTFHCWTQQKLNIV
jgi:hypothetical protein